MSRQEIYELLEERALRYNHPDFIATDPIQIPHRYGQKENIEIAGFLAASIAWGQRVTIIKNALRLMEGMDNDPYFFLLHTGPEDWESLRSFKHRTLNGEDCLFFLRSLKNIYEQHGGLEAVFTRGYQYGHSIEAALRYFRNVFFEVDFADRSQKQVANVEKGASAKRLNMFLRWMVRRDNAGVDFGLWSQIPMSALMLPLDVHTGTQARQLGLLRRKPNDWKAVVELTEQLRQYDPEDPVKYDFALFGLGAFE